MAEPTTKPKINWQLLIDKVKAWDKPDDPIWKPGPQFNKHTLIQHLDNLKLHSHLPMARSACLGSWDYVKTHLPKEWIGEAKSSHQS